MAWKSFLAPMLHPAPPLLPPPGHTPRSLPRTFRRLLSLLAASTLLLTILSLTGVSTPRHLLEAATHRASRTGRERVWYRFPKLDNFYKGLFTLVDQSASIPEYPPNLSYAREAAQTTRRPSAIKGGGRGARSRVWNPYPDYTTDEYRKHWEGEYKACGFGGREVPDVRVFDGTPDGTPGPVFGGYELLGLDENVCFERYGRLGPYGLGYEEEAGGVGLGAFDGGPGESMIETGWGVGKMPMQRINWTGVDWGTLQRECVELNAARFEGVERVDTLFPLQSTDEELPTPIEAEREAEEAAKQAEEAAKKAAEKAAKEHPPRGMPGPAFHIDKKKHPRTAVLLRAWTGYKYSATDIANIRALVSELSLRSGGEYGVHLLVHVKDSHIPIWASSHIYQRTLQANVPREFWGIAELWNEQMMENVYSKLLRWNFRGLPTHGVYRSTFMPIQWFAHRNPQYEFFWNWEMDIRNIGHWYHLFETMGTWARAQPRRGLWERNERFYIPEVHGTYSKFTADVTAATPTNTSIWGPLPVAGVTIYPDDPKPPSHLPTPEDDKDYTWGVGEDADIITLNPMFNPEGTGWLLSADTTGFPVFPGKSGPPRRSAIIAASRVSRRLLERMHQENAIDGHSLTSEMWAPSCALHHGFKAVFVPHPGFVERQWPLNYLEGTFNNGVNGTSGGRPQSVFGELEHNFKSATWYYNAAFPGVLWRRWLGRSADGNGGEKADRKEGRLCVKGVLLHPIKDDGK